MKLHVLALAFVVLVFPLLGVADEPLQRVRVTHPDPAGLAQALEQDGFDVLWGSVTIGSVDVVTQAADRERLAVMGLEAEWVDTGRPFSEVQAERIKAALDAGDAVPTGYPTYTDVYNEMTAAAATYPGICKFVDLTTEYGQPTTYEGRHLYAVKISDNVQTEEDEPTMLVVSMHHAREIVSTVLALNVIEKFTTQYGSDPQITAIVDNNEIWVAPVWNPDGYVYVFDYDYNWRKNRRVYSGGTGVDLNRNYDFGWYTACSGDTNPSSLTYKGPSPASEVETQTMMAWSQDQRFDRIIDYHSYGREVVRGYGCMSHPLDAFLQSEATTLSQQSGYGGSQRDPSADGENIQWQMGTLGAHAFLIETATSFQPTYASALAEATLNFPGVLWMAERSTPLWGYVTDAQSGLPVVANVSFLDFTYTNGETNPSGGQWGRYNAFLPAGTYDVVFDADGYDRAIVPNVAVTSTGSTQADVTLSLPPALSNPNGGEQLPANVPTTISWSGNTGLQHQVQYTANYGDLSTVNDGFENEIINPSFYTTGGAQPWYIAFGQGHSGIAAARAGAITHSQTTWLTRTVSGGQLSFWYKVSSESGWDFFNFYVDGNQMVHASGNGSWTYYSDTLSAGTHELKWEYTKDTNTSSYSDTAWIDDLQVVVDGTTWTDVVALTNPGELSAPWTPSEVSDACAVRVRAYYPAGYYGLWDESDAAFSVVASAGDADGDGDVDVDDFVFFDDCLAGPGEDPSPTAPTTMQQCLDWFDLDGDLDVDAADYVVFAASFTGAQ